jgi:hypothetical protein
MANARCQNSVADPVFFLPLDPGYVFYRIPDPIHLSENLVKKFWVKNT